MFKNFFVFNKAGELIPNDQVANIHNWATFKSFKHREVRGIWNKFAEKTDIVAIEGNNHAGVIAAGDELGLVKLFRFPSEKAGAHFRKYVGHSSRIGKESFSQLNQNHFEIFLFELPFHFFTI